MKIIDKIEEFLRSLDLLPTRRMKILALAMIAIGLIGLGAFLQALVEVIVAAK